MQYVISKTIEVEANSAEEAVSKSVDNGKTVSLSVQSKLAIEQRELARQTAAAARTAQVPPAVAKAS